MSRASGTGSTSTKTVGRPNHTVSAIKEKYQHDIEREQANYAKGQESLKKLYDPNKSNSVSINAYDREKIAAYLLNVGSNEKNLRNAMHYMYFRSQIMFRIINWYASIWDLRCRKVTPAYSLTQENNGESMLKSLEETLDLLDLYKIHDNMYAPLLRCYLDDAVYFLWFKDDTGAFPYIINPEWCKITGKYMTGDLTYAIDMSKFRSPNYQQLIEWLGSPLKEMYTEYERTGLKFIQVPDEYAGCFKFRIDDLDHVISPFVPLLQQIADLNSLEDIQAIADEQSIFKLLVYPIKTISGSKISDDWQITPDMMLDYLERAKQLQAFPEYASVIPLLGDGLELYDFTKKSSDAEVNRPKNAQDNIMNVAGGGAVLASNNITSTAAFNAWLRSESEFAISSLMPQITGFVNRMLSYELSNPCKVDFFELTVLTKDEVRKNLMEMNQYAINSRLALGTLNGFSEKETLATLYVENDLLKLQDKMIYPLQSSFTSTGSQEEGYTPETGQGRPTVPDESLSPEGDRSRNR